MCFFATTKKHREKNVSILDTGVRVLGQNMITQDTLAWATRQVAKALVEKESIEEGRLVWMVTTDSGALPKCSHRCVGEQLTCSVRILSSQKDSHCCFSTQGSLLRNWYPQKHVGIAWPWEKEESVSGSFLQIASPSVRQFQGCSYRTPPICPHWHMLTTNLLILVTI